jgi:membrane-associated phospholipid phosphatase
MILTRRFLPTFLILLATIVLLVLYVDQPASIAIRAAMLDQTTALRVFEIITRFGESQWFLVPSGLAALLSGWMVWKKRDARAKQSLVPSGLIFLSIGLSGIAAQIVKIAVGRARPKLLEADGVYGFFPGNLAHDFHSFPSGHTNTAFALAFAVSALCPRLRLPMLLFAALIGASRIIVNAHYPSDVIGGALLAFITTSVLIYAFRKQGWLKA